MERGVDPQAIDHLSPVWTHMSDIIVEKGEGCYLFGADGNRYLDFTSGIGVTNTGHCHPHVVHAIQDQAAKLIHGQANIVFSPAVLNLVSQLRGVVPPELDGFFFSNSGAEAVEAAVKLARHATGRSNIIVFQGSFHGRTNQTMAMTTSRTIYRLGYQPLAAGVFVAPFPYAFRYGWDETTTVDFCLSELDFLLHSQTDPAETAAMVIEPVLGEGGYVPLPVGFLEKLREICDHHSILLIVDEVQSGFARTGKFYAYEHYGVTPDIVIMAKGLASGLPMSAIAAPMDLMKKWLPGTHGGTYGANPVAAAAAVATIQVINEENLVENARLRGHQLMASLRDLQGRYPFLADIRGLGLMVGVELVRSDKGANKELAERIQANCLKEKMLLLTCGTFGNVIRWIPPLIVTEEEIDRGLSIFAAACQDAA